jgi:hypothetical protein
VVQADALATVDVEEIARLFPAVQELGRIDSKVVARLRRPMSDGPSRADAARTRNRAVDAIRTSPHRRRG